MDPQDSFGCGPLVCFSLQMVGHVDALDYQDFSIHLDLAERIRRQVSLACRNPARLQRTAKGARQSASRRRDEIVYRRSVRRVYLQVHAIVFGHLIV